MINILSEIQAGLDGQSSGDERIMKRISGSNCLHFHGNEDNTILNFKCQISVVQSEVNDGENSVSSDRSQLRVAFAGNSSLCDTLWHDVLLSVSSEETLTTRLTSLLLTISSNQTDPDRAVSWGRFVTLVLRSGWEEMSHSRDSEWTQNKCINRR